MISEVQTPEDATESAKQVVLTVTLRKQRAQNSVVEEGFCRDAEL